jgi:hypothetical protein
MPERAADPDLLKLYSFGLFTQLSGAVTAGMIHLGDKLGLFVALADAGRPLTAGELAASTGLDQRWVREWAYNQAAAKIISVDADAATPIPAGDERFSLSPEGSPCSPHPTTRPTAWACSTVSRRRWLRWS